MSGSPSPGPSSSSPSSPSSSASFLPDAFPPSQRPSEHIEDWFPELEAEIERAHPGWRNWEQREIAAACRREEAKLRALVEARQHEEAKERFQPVPEETSVPEGERTDSSKAGQEPLERPPAPAPSPATTSPAPEAPPSCLPSSVVGNSKPLCDDGTSGTGLRTVVEKVGQAVTRLEELKELLRKAEDVVVQKLEASLLQTPFSTHFPPNFSIPSSRRYGDFEHLSTLLGDDLPPDSTAFLILVLLRWSIEPGDFTPLPAGHARILQWSASATALGVQYALWRGFPLNQTIIVPALQVAPHGVLPGGWVPSANIPLGFQGVTMLGLLALFTHIVVFGVTGLGLLFFDQALSNLLAGGVFQVPPGFPLGGFAPPPPPCACGCNGCNRGAETKGGKKGAGGDGSTPPSVPASKGVEIVKQLVADGKLGMLGLMNPNVKLSFLIGEGATSYVLHSSVSSLKRSMAQLLNGEPVDDQTNLWLMMDSLAHKEVRVDLGAGKGAVMETANKRTYSGWQGRNSNLVKLTSEGVTATSNLKKLKFPNGHQLSEFLGLDNVPAPSAKPVKPKSTRDAAPSRLPAPVPVKASTSSDVVLVERRPSGPSVPQVEVPFASPKRGRPRQDPSSSSMGSSSPVSRIPQPASSLPAASTARSPPSTSLIARPSPPPHSRVPQGSSTQQPSGGVAFLPIDPTTYRPLPPSPQRTSSVRPPSSSLPPPPPSSPGEQQPPRPPRRPYQPFQQSAADLNAIFAALPPPSFDYLIPDLFTTADVPSRPPSTVRAIVEASNKLAVASTQVRFFPAPAHLVKEYKRIIAETRKEVPELGGCVLGGRCRLDWDGTKIQDFADFHSDEHCSYRPGDPIECLWCLQKFESLADLMHHEKNKAPGIHRPRGFATIHDSSMEKRWEVMREVIEAEGKRK